jgi:hypothetical protein
MNRPLAGLRKKRSSVASEPLPSIPFTQRFEGKISHVSKFGLNDILLASREVDDKSELIRSQHSEAFKKSFKPMKRKSAILTASTSLSEDK